MVRKAVPAAAFLGTSAFLFLGANYTLAPFSLVVGLMGTIAGFAGIWLLLRDPIMADARQRPFLYATLAAAVASWILRGMAGGVPQTTSEVILQTVGLLSLMAFVALPLWLLARRERVIHWSAGGLALACGAWMLMELRGGNVAAPAEAQRWFALGGAAAGSWLLAWRLNRGGTGTSLPVRRKPPVAIAWNPRTLSSDQRRERLHALEERYRRGELSEHEYLDRRQELDG